MSLLPDRRDMSLRKEGAERSWESEDERERYCLRPDGSVDLCLLCKEGVTVLGLTARGLREDELCGPAGSAAAQLQHVLKVVS